MSKKKSSRKLDWSRYTNFAAQNSKEDLAQMCAKLKQSQLVDVFSSPDKTGLYPIHWAAIHNRSDFIEFMIDSGSPIRISCLNKMLANGTALHLAAMNGCIEAIATLLNKYQSRIINQTTVPKSSVLEENPSYEREHPTSWLEYRDSEGQTPLMRSAAPRSKRMDTFRDLLRKNLWSFSGRPSETALFLINKGAKWREVDNVYGMNLLHLAIINNYEDIVNMLLFIDSKLISIIAKVPARIRKSHTKESSTNTASFTTIQLDPPPSTNLSQISSFDPNASADQSSKEPLISKQETQRNLLTSGLMPLQLAILYGRLGIITLLWRTENYIHSKSIEIQSSKSIEQESYESKRFKRKELELRRIITRVFWSSRTELISFLRENFLKFALFMDAAIMALIWIPVYLTSSQMRVNLTTGIFMLSFSLTVASVSRVISKDPGNLPKNTIEYLDEMNKIVYTESQAPISEEFDTSGLKESTTTQKSMLMNQAVAIKDKENTNKLDMTERVRVLCHRCRCVREARSRHCSHCNHCVRDFDHHCLYLGSCIGRNNRVEFLLMQMLLALTAIYGTVVMASSLQRNQWRQVVHFIGFVWIFKYVVIGCLSVFLNMRRASQGVTMYEMIRSNRIRKIFGPRGPPADISKSHKLYSNKKGSFWRYSPDRFLIGDLPLRKVMDNLREFFNTYSY